MRPRVLTSAVLRRGGPLVFACPRCGTDRQGRRTRTRGWHLLGRLPLLPAGPAEPVVVCGTCSGRFDTAVLHAPTNRQLTHALAEAVPLLTVAVLNAADAVGPAALESALAFASRAVPGDADARLGAALAQVPTTEEWGPLLRPLALGMSPEGREQLVTGLTRLALTCGPITEGQRGVLQAAGRGLGMTALHVEGLVALTAMAQAPRRDDRPPA